MKLLQHGADKSIRGWHNETPLEAAQRKNHAAIIALPVAEEEEEEVGRNASLSRIPSYLTSRRVIASRRLL